MRIEPKRVATQRSRTRSIDSNRVKLNRYHLADLLSRKDVKEGFNRKPTTIEVRKIELKDDMLRYTEGS